MEEKITYLHSNAIKPFLIDKNKLHRIAYVADCIITANGSNFMAERMTKLTSTKNGFSSAKKHWKSIWHKERKEIATILSKHVKARCIL